MRLDVTLRYLQLLQVTIGYQRYHVFGCMCRICYWFLVRIYLGYHCSGLYYASIVFPSRLAIGWVTMLPPLLGNITINRQLFSALSPISSHYCLQVCVNWSMDKTRPLTLST